MRTRPFAAAVLFGLLATPARADLVFFQTGRAMSVAGYRIEGPTVVLRLRAGGEVVCDASVIQRIEPDEVPYPASAVATVDPLVGGPVPMPYAEIIDAVSARHGVDPVLVRAVVEVESAFEPRARSAKGALGLMQLMPPTARRYAVQNPFDPHANLDAGVRHLRSLLDRFELSLALAAYNAGEAAVQRFGGIPPYPETRRYVARILGLVAHAVP